MLAVGFVVEADLDEVEIEGGAHKAVVVADVHLVTKDVDVVVLVGTDFVEVISMVKVLDAVIG